MGDTPTSIAQLMQDGILAINDGYRAKNEELSKSGLPFARAQNINNGFHFDDADCMPFDAVAKIGNKTSEPGDVVFTSKGTVGRFALVRKDTPRFVYAPQLCFWRSLNRDTLDARWLYYWMHSREFFDQYKGVAGQTDMAEYVSLGDQRRMHITLPPLPTQRAIAGVLGALDDKIEVNRGMARTLEAAARALFESWFVRFEHPGGKPPAPRLVDSPMGPIPEGWSVRPLDTIARFLNGLALQKYPPKDGEPMLPVIKISQLRKGDTAGADQANTEIAADYVVSDGDMLFSWSGSLECVLWTGGPGALNQHLFKVTSAEFPQWFLYLWVQHHLPEFRHIAAAKATTMGHIQRHHLTNALVAVPPAKVLAEMGRTLGPMIEAIPYRMIEARTLAAMRDSLLPRLISGELETPAAMLKEAAR